MIVFCLKKDLLVPKKRDKKGLKRIIKIKKGTIYRYYDNELAINRKNSKPVILAKKHEEVSSNVFKYYDVLKLPANEVYKYFKKLKNTKKEECKTHECD